LIFYLIIYKISKATIKGKVNFKKSFIWGLFSFFSFSIYPDYFPILFIAGSLLFFINLTCNNLKNRLIYISFFMLGAIICFSFFEIISRIAGMSYFNEAFKLSGTIIQGSFEESFTFILKYLFFVEGFLGISIFIGFILFIVFMIKYFIHKKYKIFDLEIITFLSVLFIFLFYASLGYFFHKFVQYGRLIHQYFPFIIIFSIFGFEEILQAIKIRREVFYIPFILVLIFILNKNITNLEGLGYPRDICKELKKNNFLKTRCVYEYPELFHSYCDDLVKENLNTNSILLNAALFFPLENISTYKQYKPSEDLKLMFSKPLYINFNAYKYEGYSIKERENISKMNLHVALFFNYKKEN